MNKNFKDLQRKMDSIVAEYEKEYGRLENRISAAIKKKGELLELLAKAEEEENEKDFVKYSNMLNEQECLITLCRNKQTKLDQKLKDNNAREFVREAVNKRDSMIKEYEDKARPLLKQIVEIADEMVNAYEEYFGLLDAWKNNITELPAGFSAGSLNFAAYTVAGTISDIREDMYNHNVL